MTTRRRATGEKMPFAIEQANLMTLGLAVVVMGAFFIVVTADEARWTPVLASLAVGFLVPAFVLGFVPFNIFYGVGGPRSRSGGYPRIADLNVTQRRVLLALYDPRNRRRAFAAATAALVTWLIARGFLLRVRPPRTPVFRANDLFVASLIPALICGAWAAFFGLTSAIRRNWCEISALGKAWPPAPEFPGPYLEAAKSFFTGSLPAFLTQDQA